jgi:hypothetical protein
VKLALSEHGLIQLYFLFDAAEQRCEHLRRELVMKGDHEGAACQEKRRAEYAQTKQRILIELEGVMPRSKMGRFIQLLRSTWRHLLSMWRYYYFPQRS